MRHCSAEVPRRQRRLRLVVGVIALSGFAGFFMSGITAPGVFGEVVRHNQDRQINTSPLFHSDVECTERLEAGVEALRMAAAAWRVEDSSLVVRARPKIEEKHYRQAN